jgi:outer membrane receptor for ferrienterochelin and colicins
MRKRSLLTALLCCTAYVSFAQMTFKGRVVDEDGEPVLCATVRLEKTTLGVVTNDKGEFVLANVPNGNYVMRASRMDYQASRLNVDQSKQDIQFVLTKSYLNLNEVVVTGTGTHHRLKDSPVSVELINSKDISNTGSFTFEDALSTLTSSIATKGAANIVVNGLGNKHVLILVDGKRLAGDTGGDNDLSRIDMSNVKRIEIVKGGASSLYGSDAMGGVINIITNQPQSLLDITSATRISKYGQFTQAVNVGVKYKKFSSQTSYQRRQTDGWQLSKYEVKTLKKPDRDTLISTDKQAVTAFKSNIVSQEFAYRPTKALSLYTKGTFYNRETDRAYSAYSYDMSYKDYNLALGGQYQFKKHTDYISFDTYFDNYEYYKKYFKKSGKFEVGDKDLSKRQRYLNSTLKGVFGLNKNNKLNTGLDFVNDYLDNPGNMDASKNAYTLSFYAQDEIKLIERLQIVAGFRLLHHETFKNRFTPKLSLMYSLEHFNFRGSYAAGYRTPNLMELYYDYESGSMISQGNKNLTPEKSNYFSLNTEYISKYFTASITGYINHVKDIIERKSKPLTDEDVKNGIKTRYAYENVSKARTRGVDLSMNGYIHGGFSVGLNYSYLDARNLDDNSRLFGSSRHTGTITANWTKDWSKYRLNVNLNGRLQSNTYYPNMNARTYQIWNLATNHTFRGMKYFTIEPGFGIENLFDFKDDKPFGSRYANTSPGRTYYANLILKFKK